MRTLKFESADGTVLQGDLLTPAQPLGTAVVCHAHPLYGGTRQDAVVAALCRGLVGVGRRVLRFDFRGAGASGGTHAAGPRERADLEAAIEAVEPAGTGLTIAGYSFGADIALSVEHPNASGWLVVAPPLSTLAMDQFVAAADGRPVHILQPTNDQFNPPDRLREITRKWKSTEVHVIDAADHFLAGGHLIVTTLAGELVG